MIKTGGSNTYQIEVIETMSALIEVVALSAIFSRTAKSHS